MLDLLSQLSDATLFIVLSVFFVSVSIIGIILVKRYIPKDLRTADSAAIGYVSQLISMIFSVLIGLTALYLFNNNSYTANAVQQEANAVADVFRDSRWMKEPARSNIQQQVKEYVNNVIRVEWPLMRAGDMIDAAGDIYIDHMTNYLETYKADSQAELLVLREMLTALRNLYDARQQRIQMSHSELSPELWVVVILGTILTIMINYLYAMNFYLHLVTVGAAALMTSSMLFLVITLDRPYQGEFGIGPEPMEAVKAYIERKAMAAPIVVAPPNQRIQIKK